MGERGDRGQSGGKGDMGDEGEKGCKGEFGEVGQKGDFGLVGAKGQKGDAALMSVSVCSRTNFRKLQYSLHVIFLLKEGIKGHHKLEDCLAT